jgi:enoyl-CoA hydratase/carnithine racemase
VRDAAPPLNSIGSELILVTDMRFASREKAVLSQWEVGAGLVAGGGPQARLPRLVGRGRAIEILIASDDINGNVAERYGYVNRALPDAEMDAFVDTPARRIASFERQAIVDTKRLVDIASLPPAAEMQPIWNAFIASVGRPQTQARLKSLIDGLAEDGGGREAPGPHHRRLSQLSRSGRPLTTQPLAAPRVAHDAEHAVGVASGANPLGTTSTRRTT